MPYQIDIAKSAARDFKRLDGTVKRRVQVAIDALKENPRPPGVKKLEDSDDLWRIRVGDYRIIYSVVDDKLLVLVVRVRHRKDAYRSK